MSSGEKDLQENNEEKIVGAFISLKSANLVSKKDIQIYNSYAHDTFKGQISFMLFLTFWARMLDIGNIVAGFKTKKKLYYAGFILAPSLVSCFYFSSKFISKTSVLDKKYSKMFKEFQKKNNQKN